MNNYILDIFKGKDRKKCEYLVSLLKTNKFEEFNKIFNEKGANLELSRKKYVNKVMNIFKKQLLTKPDLLVYTYNNLFGMDGYNLIKEIIEKKPSLIADIIKTDHIINKVGLKDLILVALNSGYTLSNEFIKKNLKNINDKNIILLLLDYNFNPDSDFINNNGIYFDNVDIMIKLIEMGYRPSDKQIESFNCFIHQELFLKLLDLDYKPTTNFLKKYKFPKNQQLLDLIFSKIEMTFEIAQTFSDNPSAQRKMIKEHPEFLIKITDWLDSSFESLWIEAIKNGYIINFDDMADYSLKYRLCSNYTIMSRLIKNNPKYIKYIDTLDTNMFEQLSSIALSIGYIPTINGIKENPKLASSIVLMKTLIMHRPEAIKYVQLSNQYDSDFLDLCRFAIDCGYIPTIEDLNINNNFYYSFDIMKHLIQINPDLILKVSGNEKIEDLIKIAIDSGFNGDFNYSFYSFEPVLKYYIKKYRKLPDSFYKIEYRNNYSIELYNLLIDSGYETKDIINLFVGNFDVMKILIKKNPNYILYVKGNGWEFDQKEIDELCLFALDCGYKPKFEDDIFGYGPNSAKIMVKMYPQFLDKVNLFRVSGLNFVKIPEYDEICNCATNYKINPEYAGHGYDNISDFVLRYRYNYNIMKQYIIFNPTLIEYCEINNKVQYDELCRLALKHGYAYNYKDDYVLDHWGKNMLSNYDIMATIIPNKPYLIEKITVIDPFEIEKLLDLAFFKYYKDRYYEINSQILSLIAKLDKEKWSKYLSDKDIELLDKLTHLSKKNNEVINTVNEHFIDNERIKEIFNNEQIEILICYPDIQKNIYHIISNNFSFTILKKFMNKYSKNFEWINLLDKFLYNIESGEFKNLLIELEDKDLTDEEFDNLLCLLLSDNHLDITTYQDLKNINYIKLSFVDELIKRDTISSLKSAYLEKVFGISLDKAILLVKTYGESIGSKAYNNLDEETKKQFVILENIKKIISINNIDILKYYINNVNPDFIVTPDLIVTYELKLKNIFIKEFNKSFTKPLSEDKVISNVNGEDAFDIYLAAGKNGNKKFRMMITSIGAYTEMPEPDDYYASWNVNMIASHGCCCSYVGEKNLGTAEIKYCCFGFTDYEDGSLHLSAPYDLCSSSDDKEFKVKSMHPCMYLLPDDDLNYTRHTHNETVWERRNITRNTKFKKQPSYIVYFVDKFEDRLTNPEAMRQWEAVKKASKDFSITVNGVKKSLPIMVVEREKVAKSQYILIQNKLEIFKNTLDLNLIEDIIVSYESNYAGNREFHTNISEKYFPKTDNLSESVVGKIIQILKQQYNQNPKLAHKCINELDKVINQEKNKYNNTKHGVGQSLPSFNIEESLFEINRLKEKFKINSDSTLNIINTCSLNNRQFMGSDVKNISKEEFDEQLSSDKVLSIMNEQDLIDKVVMFENEINEEHINSKLKVHGPRHIKNVVLYSALIGQNIITDKKDLNLLLVAAKYHDIGRITDAYESHASNSADIVKEKLAGKYSDGDLAIISTIIEFHEYPRDLENDNIFVNIARKNGVSDDLINKVRQMAEVLKDADALDRTRFINKARINPQFLKYNISKQLIEFASSIQETYALKDLENFGCEESIKILLNAYTPQYVLRMIRHSMNGYSNSSELENFINLWAYSIKNNCDNQHQRLF